MKKPVENDFWAVILAGGKSERMGFPKLLLPFKGITMIESVIRNVAESKVNKIMVVLGANSDKIEKLINGLDVQHCYNDNYSEGMLSSVKYGFRNIPDGYKAVLVFQGDQPLISPLTINIVINEFLSSKKGLVIPVYNSKRGHPFLISSKYHDEIQKLDPALGLRSLSEKFSNDVREVATTDEGIMVDFDTYDDYLKEINKTHKQ